MNDDLRIKTEEWKNLERTTFKQRAVAEDYYEKKMMKLIIREFIDNNKNKVKKPIKEMILSVGTSYEPLVLSINLFKPERILFLYTEKSLTYLEKVIKICKLPMSRYVCRKIDENNPLNIYQEVKNIYLEWDRPEEILLDFTGGTKAMSVAAAMASAMVDIQLIYIGSTNYLPDFRKPEPGSEFVQYIANPYEIFGDLEIGKALNLINEYNYAGARIKLVELLDKVPSPVIRQQLELIYFLVHAYEYWDDLKFEEAQKQMKHLYKNLIRDSKCNDHLILSDCTKPLKVQLDCLAKLTEMKAILTEKGNFEVLKSQQHIVPLMFTMYINAGIREAQGKYDMATLLWYRLLEMISQRRLAVYGLNVSQAEYMTMEYPLDKLPHYKVLSEQGRFEQYKKEIYELKTALFHRQSSSYLPDQISLLEGFIHLCVLHDDLMLQDDIRPIDQVKKIRYMVSLRNHSIFAHGLVPVDIVEYKKFKGYVNSLFRYFCKIEKVDFDKIMENLTWINPADTNYYNF